MAASNGRQPSPEGGRDREGATRQGGGGTALAGLDALDLATAGPGGGRRRLGLRLWNGLWPKVLAIALVLGIWELITLSGYKKLIWPATGPTLVNLWDQAKTATL